MNSSANLSQSFSLSCFVRKPDSDLVRTVKIMAILLVGGFAVFGNILIIFLAARFTVKRNIHHLIINMAVADTLVGIIFSFDNILSLLRLSGPWNLWDNGLFANILCKANSFFRQTSMFVTLTTLLIISVERLKSLKVKTSRVRPYTLTKRLALVSCSWLLSMGLSAYIAWYTRIHKIKCFPGPASYSKTYSILQVLAQLCVLVMMCLVVILNVMTSFRLWKSRPTSPQGNISDEQNRTRAKLIAKAVKMVLFSLLLFICCYLPYFILEFCFAFSYAKIFTAFQLDFWCTFDWEALFFILYDFLPLVNSCFSPCIYIVFLTEFRQAAKRLLC